MPWLVIRFCASSAAGRSTSSTAAMPASCHPASARRRAGVCVVTRVTTRPNSTGTTLSSTATTNPTQNSATTSPRA